MVQHGQWYKGETMPSVIDGSDNFDSGYGLGVGQSWQDMKTERVMGTPYINDTSKPISVQITLVAESDEQIDGWFSVDGVTITGIQLAEDTSMMKIPVSFIVPSGSTYVYNEYGVALIETWTELRGV